jgi:hypothetical protein
MWKGLIDAPQYRQNDLFFTNLARSVMTTATQYADGVQSTEVSE